MCCQRVPSILVEPRQCQQNASISIPDSSVGTIKNRKERGQVIRVAGIWGGGWGYRLRVGVGVEGWGWG